MLQIHSYQEGLELFKALGSETRLNIVRLLAQNGPMAPGELSAALGITSSALTAHTQKLEETGMIGVESSREDGRQKKYTLLVPQIFLDPGSPERESQTGVYEADIRIGDYRAEEILSPCGIALSDRLLTRDSPAAFPQEGCPDAQLLWMQEGSLAYRIPNKVPEGCRVIQLTVSFELSSCCCGNDPERLGDTAFFLNGRSMGKWTSFGASGFTRGIYTPDWWTGQEMQHGFLKMFVANNKGVYLDGKMIEEANLLEDPIRSSDPMILRLSAFPSTCHKGGLAIYGSGFGSYRQDIRVRIHYTRENRTM